jgi:ribonucleoside-diphosphate reductase alpha chain
MPELQTTLIGQSEVAPQAVEVKELVTQAPVAKVSQQSVYEQPKPPAKDNTAPLCYNCGNQTQRAGTCYVCSSCGSTTGCS